MLTNPDVVVGVGEHGCPCRVDDGRRPACTYFLRHWVRDEGLLGTIQTAMGKLTLEGARDCRRWPTVASSSRVRSPTST